MLKRAIRSRELLLMPDVPKKKSIQFDYEFEYMFHWTAIIYLESYYLDHRWNIIFGTVYEVEDDRSELDHYHR